MIDKQLARRLLPLVNSEDFTVLVEYAIARLETRSKDAMQAKDMETLKFIQGSAKELELIRDLKSYVDQDKG